MKRRKSPLKQVREAEQQEQSLWERDPKKARLLAKAMFYLFRPKNQIVEETGIKLRTLERWIAGKSDGRGVVKPGWKHQRQEVEDKLIHQIVKKKSKILNSICARGLSLLDSNLALYEKAEVTLNPKEMKQISSILGEIDKIFRLEMDMPTEIRETITNPRAHLKSLYERMREADRELLGDEGIDGLDTESGGITTH